MPGGFGDDFGLGWRSLLPTLVCAVMSCSQGWGWTWGLDMGVGFRLGMDMGGLIGWAWGPSGTI